MSVCRCRKCDRIEDTDYHDGGQFDDRPPFGYLCERCAEEEAEMREEAEYQNRMRQVSHEGMR